ncbi:hypothetical protein [uncultured Chloroflexus sp.]|uniref:hypothetical protein n=1 Tax=uncultured Chloroflexus sp. TaxID=214040 RepID=UPI002621A195|nr:hypothetical protein [uncultured Chloroflexus sp.]
MHDSAQGARTLLAVVITFLLYGAACWLWWQQRNPLYVFALAAGQLSTLLEPFWRLLYSIQTVPSLTSLVTALTTPFNVTASFRAAWPDTLPAMIIAALYLYRWWNPGLLNGLFTYAIFISIQLLASVLGLRDPAPPALLGSLSFGISAELLAALMSATITYGLCYVFITVQNYSWPSMAAAILPMPLFFGGLVYGVTGAPLLISRLLPDGEWPTRVGLVLTLLLLGWCVAIITSGLNRLNRVA